MDKVTSPEDLNISLEPHLVRDLQTLQRLAPQELSTRLAPFTCSSPPPTIPYSVLRSISRWSCSEGIEVLRSHSPPLDHSSYSMVSLLAGTTTSPERRFTNYIPPPEPEQVESLRIAEKKSITALLNGLLSTFGCGLAVWWAADKLQWRNEWRVLLALFTSIVVAVAEAVLNLIWQSRVSSSTSKLRHRVDRYRAHLNTTSKQDASEINTGEEFATITTSVEEVTDGGLRRRK